MDLIEIIQARQSVRASQSTQIKQALAKAAGNQDFLAEAPVVLVFCTHPARSAARYGERGKRLYCLQDASIAIAYAQLAATALGLASCWVGAFNDEQVARAIHLPTSQHPVAILPVGYPGESPLRAPRRSLPDLVHHIP
ncbi:MAG: nitroreductase family protein [Anaerolineae bacterium]